MTAKHLHISDLRFPSPATLAIHHQRHSLSIVTYIVCFPSERNLAQVQFFGNSVTDDLEIDCDAILQLSVQTWHFRILSSVVKWYLKYLQSIGVIRGEVPLEYSTDLFGIAEE